MAEGYTLSTSNGQSSGQTAPPGTPATGPDPHADYWTIADVAAYWRVSEQTIRAYRSRGRGELPPSDRTWGRSPVWRPATITSFQRLGQGARTDLH
jgi:hypothetical protein